MLSEAIDSSELHSARLGERGSVVAERRGHIPLVLHGKSVEASVIEHVKYAPTQLERVALSVRNLPLLGEIYVRSEITIAANGIA